MGSVDTANQFRETYIVEKQEVEVEFVIFVIMSYDYKLICIA